MDHDDEPEDDDRDLDLDHHAEWCKDNPIERALEETVQTGKNTTELAAELDLCMHRDAAKALRTLSAEVDRLRYAHAEAMSLVSTASAELTRLRAELAHANELREHYYQNWRGVSGALMDASSVNAGDPQEVGVRELIAQRDRLRAVAEAARVLHAKLERETVDDPVAWADQMVGDALAALEGT